MSSEDYDLASLLLAWSQELEENRISLEDYEGRVRDSEVEKPLEVS